MLVQPAIPNGTEDDGYDKVEATKQEVKFAACHSRPYLFIDMASASLSQI